MVLLVSSYYGFKEFKEFKSTSDCYTYNVVKLNLKKCRLRYLGTQSLK